MFVKAGDSFNLYSYIKCPDCGGDNLHQVSVESFDPLVHDNGGNVGHYCRVEHPDNGFSEIRSEPKWNLFVGTDVSKNPSGRRQGVTISFRCEACPSRTALDIYQSKGTTYWEFKKL